MKRQRRRCSCPRWKGYVREPLKNCIRHLKRNKNFNWREVYNEKFKKIVLYTYHSDPPLRSPAFDSCGTCFLKQLLKKLPILLYRWCLTPDKLWFSSGYIWKDGFYGWYYSVLYYLFTNIRLNLKWRLPVAYIQHQRWTMLLQNAAPGADGRCHRPCRVLSKGFCPSGRPPWKVRTTIQIRKNQELEKFSENVFFYENCLHAHNMTTGGLGSFWRPRVFIW